MVAAACGYPGIKLLLDIRAKFDLKGYITGGHIKAVKLLLGGGADVNDKSLMAGCTALQLSAGQGHNSVLPLLLDNVATTND